MFCATVVCHQDMACSVQQLMLTGGFSVLRRGTPGLLRPDARRFFASLACTSDRFILLAAPTQYLSGGRVIAVLGRW
jgi:hypothetical protein